MKKKRWIALVIGVVFMLSCGNVSAATVKDLLAEGMKPIGKCLYVYGGGWNEADNGAGLETMRYGLGAIWEMFYQKNTSDYDYKKTKYQIHNGLDCTGFVGWTMYQLFGSTYSDKGYVFSSGTMVKTYAKLFGGTVVSKNQLTRHQCGDVMGSKGHVYLVLGECKDGSIVMLNMSPPALSICGTAAKNGTINSEAVALAKRYMEKYFAGCVKKYPNYRRGTDYLTDYDAMRWNENVLPDPDGYRNKTADEILSDFFETLKVYINGDRIFPDVEPNIIDGITYVPLRAVSQALKATVAWEMENKTAVLRKGDVQIKVNTAAKTIESFGKKSSAALIIEKDRILIPIRYVAENFDCQVDWHGQTKSVVITTKDLNH